MTRRGTDFTGLLSSIGENSGRTGAGYQYIDTFKRQMAPELDRDDSTSLMNYSQWARRNGYDEEANRYENLGIERAKVEGKQSYKKGVQGMSQALDNISNAQAQIGESQDPTDLLRMDALTQAHASTVERMNALGMESEYGTGREGSEAVANRAAARVAAEEHAIKLGEYKMKKEEADAKRDARLAEGAIISPELIPEHLRQTYINAMNSNQLGLEGQININKRFEGQIKDFQKLKEERAVSSAALAVETTVRSLIDEGQNGMFTDDFPINDYLTDDSNETRVAQAKELTKGLLSKDLAFIYEEDREAQKAMARKTFMETLRDLDGKFYEAMGNDRQARVEQKADEDRKGITVTRNYKKGMFPGDTAYNEELENTRRIIEEAGLEWDAQDRRDFDEDWDERHRNRGNTDLTKSFANPGTLMSGMK